MTDIRDRLREADPVVTEPAPPAEEVAAMRRRVLEAVAQPADRATAWKRTLAIAAAVALVAGAGIDTARRTSRPAQGPATITAVPASAVTTRTQVQFSTPGGTRVIWTIDPAFQLTEKR